MSIFSENIRYLRKQKDWSQDKLASKLGYKSLSTIAKWKSGMAEPSIDTIRVLSKVFSVEITDLLERDLSEPGESYSTSKEYNMNPKDSNRLIRNEVIVFEIMDKVRKMSIEQREELSDYADYILQHKHR